VNNARRAWQDDVPDLQQALRWTRPDRSWFLPARRGGTRPPRSARLVLRCGEEGRRRRNLVYPFFA